MSEPRLYIGTSGWTYDDWVGVFYPRNLKPAERLGYYVGEFNTLEINVTFYRTPSQVMINAWNRSLPVGFPLIVKGPRSITHLARLQGGRQELESFWQRVCQLSTLRVILWQLPPSLKRDDGLLEDFLVSLPDKTRHAVEFRHTSWWNDRIYDLLARHGVALVAVSHPGMPEILVPTTDFLYLRFHGLGKQLYHYDYSSAELSVWSERVRPLLASQAIYALFNNGYEGNAVRNARLLRELLGR